MSLFPPTYNPRMPYYQPIDALMKTGTLIRIQGVTFPNSERCKISLEHFHTASMDTIGIPLCIEISLKDQTMELNNYNMAWGRPYSPTAPVPIVLGQLFEILILCDLYRYKIAVNGENYCDFPHRMAPMRVANLRIDGDITIKLVSFEAVHPRKAPGLAVGRVKFTDPTRTETALGKSDELVNLVAETKARNALTDPARKSTPPKETGVVAEIIMANALLGFGPLGAALAEAEELYKLDRSKLGTIGSGFPEKKVAEYTHALLENNPRLYGSMLNNKYRNTEIIDTDIGHLINDKSSYRNEVEEIYELQTPHENCCIQ